MRLLGQAPSESTRYKRQIDSLHTQGKKTTHIEKVVIEATNNLNAGNTRFVIYGEPQSGKTEMMIALTAKLLDEGHKIIVVLLNDSISLLEQNLDRFRESGINPTPEPITHILEQPIGDRTWIIFSKKNGHDLEKVYDKLRDKKTKVIIDDEADYASPNTKINKDKRSRINDEISKLLGKDGIYIGVTATPARLDLNSTFDNIAEKWICFEPHELYVGKDDFFPMDSTKPFSFNKKRVLGDDPKYLRSALLSFLVNVGFININTDIKNKMKTAVNENANCSFLIHTSGSTERHDKDARTINNIFNILADQNDPEYKKFLTEIWQIAEAKYGSNNAYPIVEFIRDNNGQKYIEVLNNKKKSGIDTTKATALFTIIIGGNIISRGITINNLIGMFFTREAKNKIQQDTYIQRARMFGNRKDYLNLFELWIPDDLYMDWHKCFVYHYLSLEAIKTQESAPIWIADYRITPVASNSIDKKTVVTDKGAMYFGIFQYTDKIEKIIGDTTITDLRKLEIINEQFGDVVLPKYLINFINTITKPYEGYIAVHQKIRPAESKSYTEDLRRPRGVLGGHDIDRYPQAIHHVRVLRDKMNQSRIIYRYSDRANLQFYKNLRNKDNG